MLCFVAKKTTIHYLHEIVNNIKKTILLLFTVVEKSFFSGDVPSIFLSAIFKIKLEIKKKYQIDIELSRESNLDFSRDCVWCLKKNCNI